MKFNSQFLTNTPKTLVRSVLIPVNRFTDKGHVSNETDQLEVFYKRATFDLIERISETTKTNENREEVLVDLLASTIVVEEENGSYSPVSRDVITNKLLPLLSTVAITTLMNAITLGMSSEESKRIIDQATEEQTHGEEVTEEKKKN